MRDEALAWLMQSAPAEWSLIGEAFRVAQEIASGLTVIGILLVVIFFIGTRRYVHRDELDAALKREDEWKQEARRGERAARRGAETIETTAEVVEKDR